MVVSNISACTSSFVLSYTLIIETPYLQNIIYIYVIPKKTDRLNSWMIYVNRQKPIWKTRETVLMDQESSEFGSKHIIICTI